MGEPHRGFVQLPLELGNLLLLREDLLVALLARPNGSCQLAHARPVMILTGSGFVVVGERLGVKLRVPAPPLLADLGPREELVDVIWHVLPASTCSWCQLRLRDGEVGLQRIELLLHLLLALLVALRRPSRTRS